ncbi:MAG: S8 family peptidase [Bacillota bacterium]
MQGFTMVIFDLAWLIWEERIRLLKMVRHDKPKKNNKIGFLIIGLAAAILLCFGPNGNVNQVEAVLNPDSGLGISSLNYTDEFDNDTEEKPLIEGAPSTGSGQGDSFKSNEIIVRFKPQAMRKASVVNSVHMDVGARLKKSYRIVEGLQLVEVSDKSVDEAIRQYTKNPNVLYAEPNYRVALFGNNENSGLDNNDHSTSIKNEANNTMAVMTVGNEAVTQKLYKELKGLTNESGSDTSLNDQKSALNEQKKIEEAEPSEIDSNIKDAFSKERYAALNVENYYEVEPNSPITESNIVNSKYTGTPSYNIYGTITDYYWDLDYYRFDVIQDGEIDILGIWAGNYYEWGYEDDLAIGLLDENGNVLQWADLYSLGDGLCRNLVYDLQAGTYYLLVFQSSDYEYLYINEYYRLSVIFEPDIVPVPSFRNLWGLENVGQVIEGQEGIEGADIKAVPAWSISKGADEIIIAVVDTGVDYSHEELSDNMWTDSNGYHGWDFVDNDSYPMDENGHGTHISGTIAAIGGNENEMVGVMWDASIMALRVFDADGYSYLSDIINAIEFANSHGAQVINLSLGGYDYSQSLKDALEEVNALLVAAAGNDGSDNDQNPCYPASYDLSNLISVAATDNRDNLANFSNYGSQSVHVGAPGSAIFSTVPDNLYAYFYGTSCAAPHVSGLAGLILSINPCLSYEEVANVIKNSVDILNPNLYGKVSTNGRVNAYNALVQAESMIPEGTGIIDKVVIKIGDRQVVFDIVTYALALAAGEGNEVYDYMAEGSTPLITAIGSGQKFISITDYALALASTGEPEEAIYLAEPLPYTITGAYIYY